MRALETDDFTERMVPYLQRAGIVGDSLSEHQAHVLRAAAPLVQERMETLDQAPGMLGFLLIDPGAFAMDEKDAAAVVDSAGPALDAAAEALLASPEWTTPAIEAALRGALIDGLGLKPRQAFGGVRVAITGRRVSPPLFESMELLGREESLRRLGVARDRVAAAAAGDSAGSGT